MFVVVVVLVKILVFLFKIEIIVFKIKEKCMYVFMTRIARSDRRSSKLEEPYFHFTSKAWSPIGENLLDF